MVEKGVRYSVPPAGLAIALSYLLGYSAFSKRGPSGTDVNVFEDEVAVLTWAWLDGFRRALAWRANAEQGPSPQLERPAVLPVHVLFPTLLAGGSEFGDSDRTTATVVLEAGTKLRLSSSSSIGVCNESKGSWFGGTLIETSDEGIVTLTEPTAVHLTLPPDQAITVASDCDATLLAGTPISYDPSSPTVCTALPCSSSSAAPIVLRAGAALCTCLPSCATRVPSDATRVPPNTTVMLRAKTKVQLPAGWPIRYPNYISTLKDPVVATLDRLTPASLENVTTVTLSQGVAASPASLASSETFACKSCVLACEPPRYGLQPTAAVHAIPCTRVGFASGIRTAAGNGQNLLSFCLSRDLTITIPAGTSVGSLSASLLAPHTAISFDTVTGGIGEVNMPRSRETNNGADAAAAAPHHYYSSWEPEAHGEEVKDELKGSCGVAVAVAGDEVPRNDVTIYSRSSVIGVEPKRYDMSGRAEGATADSAIAANKQPTVDVAVLLKRAYPMGYDTVRFTLPLKPTPQPFHGVYNIDVRSIPEPFLLSLRDAMNASDHYHISFEGNDDSAGGKRCIIEIQAKRNPILWKGLLDTVSVRRSLCSKDAPDLLLLCGPLGGLLPQSVAVELADHLQVSDTPRKQSSLHEASLTEAHGQRVASAAAVDISIPSLLSRCTPKVSEAGSTTATKSEQQSPTYDVRLLRGSKGRKCTVTPGHLSRCWQVSVDKIFYTTN